MNHSLIPRDEVARRFQVDSRILVRYEERGLIRAVASEGVEGYEPGQVRRLWTVLSCQRDLGINLAGVEAVLRLRDHLADVHRQLEALARRLEDDLGSQDLPTTDPDA
ncbi:MAG: chaperone modulator CbpM [Isosphaeraceae bacterium]